MSNTYSHLISFLVFILFLVLALGQAQTSKEIPCQPLPEPINKNFTFILEAKFVSPQGQAQIWQPEDGLEVKILFNVLKFETTNYDPCLGHVFRYPSLGLAGSWYPDDFNTYTLEQEFSFLDVQDHLSIYVQTIDDRYAKVNIEKSVYHHDNEEVHITVKILSKELL